ncbi:MAG: hydroxymethylglutaryl-CoA reductase, degradative [Candidatus Nealsonbacteria bacterium]|nr:MAG: hydroxymethylglutaryl-CoA reductase, degradative [Candidatus Nealsonbacteria bacterium]
MRKNSRIPEFFKLKRKGKIKIVKNFANLTDKEIKIIEKGFLEPEIRDKIIENVIGTFPLPYAIAVNFLINQKDYLVPMVIEEPSVVAAACYGARLTRESGGIFAKSLGNLMIGQIYIIDLKNPQRAKKKILKEKKEILKIANRQNPILTELGGGAKDLETKIFKKTKIGPILRIHLLIDTKDAMGANTVDTMVEQTAPFIEKIIGEKVLLKIVSNLAEKRLVEVKTIVTKKALKKEGFPPEETIQKIVKAQVLAETDIYRAVTNNKGILNGMGAVALATGNDWRALEAGAHGFAAKSGKYKPLAVWRKNKEGNLTGKMTVPIAVGIVGGITQVHPTARISLKILKVKSAQELAQVIASVGLVQNLAALRALVSEGIQSGHMKLHVRNIAMAVGAKGKTVDKIAKQMVKEKKINIERAKEIFEQFKK